MGVNLVPVFKVIQIIIILVFLINVSDLRKKNRTQQLINPLILIIMKATYCLPLGIFLWAVISSSIVWTKDWFALLLTFGGLIIVIFAKTTLGRAHSWTGYGAFPIEFVEKGIYSIVRHPMYVGIFICISGMTLFVLGHISFLLVLLDIIGSIYIIFVLLTSANRETQHLVNLFGHRFVEYMEKVPAYFPRVLK